MHQNKKPIPKTQKTITNSKNNPVKKKVKLSSLFTWVKKAKIINKKTCKITISLILVLWLTNPSLIPFLPENIKDVLMEITSNLLGDVQLIKNVLPLNWIKFFQIIVMLLFLYLISEIVKAILTNIRFSSKRLQTFSSVFINAMHYIFTIGGIIWALRIMGINTSVIFAGIGIISLIIGFSAESLIADMVTGAFLLFDNQYNVGDIIDVETFHGEVVKIGFRSTSLKDHGGNIKIINNSNMRDIVNRSQERSMVFCDITVPAKLNISTIEKNLKQVFQELKEKEAIFLEAPEYYGIESLESQDMVLRIVAWVDEHDIYQARRLINQAVKEKFQEMNVWR